MTKAIVGPVPSVRFHDGTVIAYRAPRDTVDENRWRACTDHRVACDCREAELAEQISELRGELEAARNTARRILAGHATYAYEDSPSNGDRPIGCMCTGRQIARKAYLLSHGEADSFARDEVDGIGPDEIDAGLRWKVCHSGVQAQFPDVCEWATKRSNPKRPYHEHLTYRTGEPVRHWDETEVPF